MTDDAHPYMHTCTHCVHTCVKNRHKLKNFQSSISSATSCREDTWKGCLDHHLTQRSFQTLLAMATRLASCCQPCWAGEFSSSIRPSWLLCQNLLVADKSCWCGSKPAPAPTSLTRGTTGLVHDSKTGQWEPLPSLEITQTKRPFLPHHWHKLQFIGPNREWNTVPFFTLIDRGQRGHKRPESLGRRKESSLQMN